MHVIFHGAQFTLDGESRQLDTEIKTCSSRTKPYVKPIILYMIWKQGNTSTLDNSATHDLCPMPMFSTSAGNHLSNKWQKIRVGSLV